MIICAAGCDSNSTEPEEHETINVKPVVEIQSIAVNYANSSANVSLDGYDPDGLIVQYDYSHDGIHPGWATSIPDDFGVDNVVLTNLSDGNHWFKVKAKDDAGDWGEEDFESFTVQPDDPVDNVSPNTIIYAYPDQVDDDGSVGFAWRGTDNETDPDDLLFSSRLEGWSDVWTPYASVFTRSFVGMTDGNYTFYVRAKDEAGNVDQTPASFDFTVEISPEEVPLEPIGVYASPAEAPYGICSDRDHLYAVFELNELVLKLRKSDLAIVQQWTLDVSGYFTGITFDGTYFWLAVHGYQDAIYKASQNFEILAQYDYPIPDGPMNDVYSLAWSGTHLWSTYDIGNDAQVIVQHNNDATLSVLGQWDVSGTEVMADVTAVFFADGSLWSTGWAGIRRYNANVSVAESWEPDEWGDFPDYPYYGGVEKRMCYDGEHFWGCAGNNVEPYITKRRGLR